MCWIRWKAVEPSLGHIGNGRGEVWPSDNLFHGTLLTVLQLYVWIILFQAKCSGEETNRPFVYSNEEDTVIETMSIVCHHQMGVLHRW